MVPGEICAKRSERNNRCCEATLSAQKSAEAIVAEKRRAESVGVLSNDRERRNAHMDAENISNDGCSQRDSAEHKGYVRAHRSFNQIWKERDSAQPDLLEKILEKDNLNRAFKRVKANKGAPGVDGMTIDETLRGLITPSYSIYPAL